MTKPITTIWLPVLAGLLISHQAHGHGTITSPPSRVYRVYQDLSDGAPNHPATDAAVNHDGGHVNACYTWNQVAKLIPNTPRLWDDEAKVPFLYNKSTGEWITVSPGHTTCTFTDTNVGRLTLPGGFYRLLIP